MIKDLKKYQRGNVEKLDCVTTGVSIERRHKTFIESQRLNLSAIVRDVLDSIMDKLATETKLDSRESDNGEN